MTTVVFVVESCDPSSVIFWFSTSFQRLLFQFLTPGALCRFGQMKQSNDKTLSGQEKKMKKCDAISSIETGLRSNTGLTSSDSDWCPLHDLGNILISCAVDRPPFPHWTRSTLYPPLNGFYPIRFFAAPVFPEVFYFLCLVFSFARVLKFWEVR